MSKKQLFEEMKFDNYQYALDVKKDAENRLAKANSVFKLSIIGSVFGIFGNRFLLLFIPAIIISIICYKKIGGFKTVFSWGWKLAQIGWFIVPVFPVDLLVGLLFFIAVPYFFLLHPIVLVYIFKKQAQKDIKQADEYLRYFKPVNENINI